MSEMERVGSCSSYVERIQQDLEQLKIVAGSLDLARKKDIQTLQEQKEEWTKEKERAQKAVDQELKVKRDKILKFETEKRAAIDAERAAWEVEKAKVASSRTFGQKIKLDVGGSRFTTTMTTLQRFPESMLGAMFSGRHALPLDEDGCYFIDRDGTHFKYVLNFLRDPENFSMQEMTDTVTTAELQKEVAYYGLQDMMFPFKPIIEVVSINVGTNINQGLHPHPYLSARTMELSQQSQNGQWFALSTALDVNQHQPVQWCRLCKIGYIVHRNGSQWGGITAFALNRSVPDNQPAPPQKCMLCRKSNPMSK